MADPTSAWSSAKKVLVRNIPRSYRSADLRRFFTDFVEGDKLVCFHFRHRPEVKANADGQNGKKDSCCCLILVAEEHVRAFLERFPGRHWTAEDGLDLPVKCFASQVKVCQSERQEDEDEEKKLRTSDLPLLAELRPPAAMPK